MHIVQQQAAMPRRAQRVECRHVLQRHALRIARHQQCAVALAAILFAGNCQHDEHIGRWAVADPRLFAGDAKSVAVRRRLAWSGVSGARRRAVRIWPTDAARPSHAARCVRVAKPGDEPARHHLPSAPHAGDTRQAGALDQRLLGARDRRVVGGRSSRPASAMPSNGSRSTSAQRASHVSICPARSFDMPHRGWLTRHLPSRRHAPQVGSSRSHGRRCSSAMTPRPPGITRG